MLSAEESERPRRFRSVLDADYSTVQLSTDRWTQEYCRYPKAKASRQPLHEMHCVRVPLFGVICKLEEGRCRSQVFSDV